MVEELVKKWYQELKKEYPELEMSIHQGGRYTFSVKEEVDGIFNKFDNTYTICDMRIREEYGILTVQIHSNYSQAQRPFNLSYAEFINRVVKEVNPSAVFLELDRRAEQQFGEPYEILDEKAEKRWNWIYKKNFVTNTIKYRVINEERVKATIKIATRVKESLLLMKKQDEMFKHRFPAYGYRLHDIYFYHQGQEGRLYISILDEGIVIEDRKDTWTVTVESADEIDAALRAYFMKVYKSKRLENMFVAPKHHFDAYMNKCVRYKDLHNTIYGILTRDKTPEEVEKHLAKTKQTRVFSTKTNPDVGIIVLIDHILVMEQNEDKIHEFKLSQKEAAEEKFRELNLKDLLEEVNNNLKKFNGAKR